MIDRSIPAVAVACLLASDASAQGPEFHYRQGGHSHGIQFLNVDSGIVVEDGGRARFQSPNTATWEEGLVDDAYREDFRGVFILDQVNAWAVGVGGAVMHSTNGGELWTWLNVNDPVLDQNSPPQPAELYDIWMLDEFFGWVVGIDGVIQFTSDGGATWGDHPTWSTTGTAPNLFGPGGTDPLDPYDIQILDGTRIVVPADWGFYYWSEDSGVTWETHNVDSCYPDLGHTNYLELWSLSFADVPDASGDYEGWMVGGVGFNGGHLYHTLDSGESWTRINDTALGAGVPPPNDCVLPTYYGVSAFPGGETVAVGYGSVVSHFESDGVSATVYDPCSNCVMGSSGAADHWEKILPVPDPADLYVADPPLTTVFSLDASHGWLCGRFGVIRRTTDGGYTWIDEGPTMPRRLAAGDFRSAVDGVVIGQGNAILRTDDGGLAWTVEHPTTPLTMEENGYSGIDIELAPGGHGVAIGQGGFVARTTDGGDAWTEVGPLPNSPTTPRAVECLDLSTLDPPPPNAFAVGHDGYFARSFDSGATWTQVTLPSPYDSASLEGVAFADHQTGYLVGQGGVALLTNDGGDGWSAVPLRNGATPTFLDVATWGDGTGAVAVGVDGAVYQKGATGKFVQKDVATLLGDPELATVDFFAVDVVEGGSTWIIGGEHGIVLMYDGLTWTRPKSKTTEPIYSVCFQSASQGHVIGKQFLVCEWN